MVIERREGPVQRFRETQRDLLYVMGDATDEAVLDHTGVGRANLGHPG